MNLVDFGSISRAESARLPRPAPVPDLAAIGPAVNSSSPWRDDDVVCRELLKNRPRLDLRAHGETPIFYAARLKRLKTLDLLIDAGANPAIVDDKGRDAVDIARARRLPKNLIDRLAESKRRSQRPTSRD